MNLLRITPTGEVIYPYSISRLAKEENVSLPTQASNEVLANHGLYKVHFTERPSGDIVTELLPEFSDGAWRQRWSVGSHSIEELKRIKMRENAAKRVMVLQSGIVYEFPDGVGTVQTRNDTDIANVQGIATMATILAGQGVTDSVLAFRDSENVTHPLTPSQAQSFGLAIGQAISVIYARKWAIDSQIEAMETAESVRMIDIEAAWNSD